MWITNLKTLLSGNSENMSRLITAGGPRWAGFCLITTAASTAVYGFTFGLWRSEAQAVCTAIKFPLVIFLTCLGNGLLNGVLGAVMDCGMTMRQSALGILMSFTITGLVLAGFAPVMLFVLWNTPPMGSAAAGVGQSITLVSHVAVIALAGYLGNLRLWQLLVLKTKSRLRALVVLGFWLSANLLLGSQISWMLRPWIGRPDREIHFFSEAPLQGNFFEAVWADVLRLFSNL